MKPIISFFLLDWKRFFSKKNLIVLLIFLLITLYCVQMGVFKYKRLSDSREEFQEFEKMKISQYINYTMYGGYGFRIFYQISPLSVFFSDSGLIPYITAFVDSGERLRIYNPLKGESIFTLNMKQLTDLSYIFLMLGSILCLYFGFNSLDSREYFRFLVNVMGLKKLYLGVIISRIIIINIIIASLLLFAKGLMVFNRISLDNIDLNNLLAYFLVTSIVLTLFFIIGVMIRTFRRKVTSYVSLFLVWIVIILVIPNFVNTYTISNAEELKSAYLLEIEKLKMVMSFERRALEKEGWFNKQENLDKEQALIESYWNGEFEKIQKLEGEMERNMRGKVSEFYWLSSLFPTSFYNATSYEVSGKGLFNFLDFYVYVQNLKRKFVRFYFDKKFYSNHTKVESFIKNDENIFYAESRLPGNFRTGVAVNLIYLVLLLGFAYYRFFNFIYGVPDIRMPQLTGLKPKMRARNMMGIITEEERVISQFYRVWSGKFGKFDHIAMVGDDNVIDPKYKGKGYPFLYVCHANQLPRDIKTIDFVRFLWGIQGASSKERAESYMELELENYENMKLGDLQRGIRAKILLGLALLKETKCVMMNDIGFGMTLNFLEYFRDAIYAMRKKDVAMLYLSQDLHTVYKMCEYGALLKTDRAIAKQVEGETDLLKFELGEPHPDAPR